MQRTRLDLDCVMFLSACYPMQCALARHTRDLDLGQDALHTNVMSSRADSRHQNAAL